jgi:uncharacterized protein YqcC (DUF446 family)
VTSSSTARYARLADILLELEMALRQHQLWEVTPPPVQARQSQQPFCFDTLRFTQWLEFVFVVRLKDMVEAQAPLPTRSGIVVIAEENFKGVNYDASSIIRCLAQFDALIEG